VNAIEIHPRPRNYVLQSIKSFGDRVTGTEPVPEADKAVARINVRVKNRGREIYLDWDGREEPGETDLDSVQKSELPRRGRLDDAASPTKGNTEKILHRHRTAVQNVNDGSIQ
jgi:hypothetical protein